MPLPRIQEILEKYLRDHGVKHHNSLILTKYITVYDIHEMKENTILKLKNKGFLFFVVQDKYLLLINTNLEQVKTV